MGKLALRLDRSAPRPLASRQKLNSRSLRKSRHPHAGEHFVGGAKLITGVASPALPAEPFPIEQIASRELGPCSRCGQMGDRLFVERLGVSVIREQRT